MKKWLHRQLHRLTKLRRNLVTALALRFPASIACLPAPAPLNVREYKTADYPSDELIIFVPGIGDVLEDYEANGFIEAVLQSRAPADMIVVDAHFGYYLRRTVVERLRQDVIKPARAGDGYKKIWIVGISLGGFGALRYASEYPGDVDALVLLAPYLGYAPIIGEIATAGGVRQWQPSREGAGADHERALWLWLQRCVTSELGLPPIYLGYGEDDKFAGKQVTRRVIAA